MIFVAENAEQVAKLTDTPEFDAQVHTIVVFDTTGLTLDDRIISFEHLRESGERYLAEHPEAVDEAIATTHRDVAVHPDLHLRHHWPAQGRPAQPHVLGLRGRRPPSTWTSSARTSCSTCGCRSATSSARRLIAVQLDYGFASAVDGRIDKIVENLGIVKPSFMCGAPRIFEKVRAAVMTGPPASRAGSPAGPSTWATSPSTTASRAAR